MSVVGYRCVGKSRSVIVSDRPPLSLQRIIKLDSLFHKLCRHCSHIAMPQVEWWEMRSVSTLAWRSGLRMICATWRLECKESHRKAQSSLAMVNYRESRRCAGSPLSLGHSIEQIRTAPERDEFERTKFNLLPATANLNIFLFIYFY